MKAIVDIPDKDAATVLTELIAKGCNITNLPEAYGRLIDADRLQSDISTYIVPTTNLQYTDLECAESYNQGIADVLDELKCASTVVESSTAVHACCFWEGTACTLGNRSCPDDYSCDYFD